MDTNVVLRAINKGDVQHPMVVAAIDRIRERGDSLVISVQVVAEFWNVATRPLDAKPPGVYGLSVHDAARQLDVIEGLFVVLADPDGMYDTWRRVVYSYGVAGAHVHDARHAAWALAHGIGNILTFNVKDFRRFRGLAAVSPAELG
ncbi:MAG: PIN domain-containing protein [Capsulimonadaceae bacterium]|nr:PIN domain-containing protein [Capsulimonadaceae bacterium]